MKKSALIILATGMLMSACTINNYYYGEHGPRPDHGPRDHWHDNGPRDHWNDNGSRDWDGVPPPPPPKHRPAPKPPVDDK